MALKESKKFIALVSLFITVFLFMTVLLVGTTFDNKREEYINNQFEKMYQDFSSMQTLFLLSDTYDQEMACLAFNGKIKELDHYIWDLGEKIDQYRIVSEEFQTDEYYLRQKKAFNENLLNYLLLMKKMQQNCNISKQLVLFFYKNGEECSKCDDQSFILTDINIMDQKEPPRDVAVFSFDMDLNLTSLDVLSRYYKIDQYPCLIINDEKACGIQDKESILAKVCEGSHLNICDHQSTFQI